MFSYVLFVKIIIEKPLTLTSLSSYSKYNRTYKTNALLKYNNTINITRSHSFHSSTFLILQHCNLIV